MITSSTIAKGFYCWIGRATRKTLRVYYDFERADAVRMHARMHNVEPSNVRCRALTPEEIAAANRPDASIEYM